MKYLVAVKIILTGESEIFEFNTLKNRTDFIEDLAQIYGNQVEVLTSEVLEQ